MSTNIQSYVITEAQKNDYDWEPQPYLNAAPMIVLNGAAENKYIIAVDLNDPAYSDMIDYLETNAEKRDFPVSNLYPLWEVGISVEKEEWYTYQGELYSCIQSHTTQANWTPPNVPALWKRESPPGVIPDWVQPTGAHDAYAKYDQVMYSGGTWESTIDANVWAPGVYGWVQI